MEEEEEGGGSYGGGSGSKDRGDGSGGGRSDGMGGRGQVVGPLIEWTETVENHVLYRNCCQFKRSRKTLVIPTR
jgi:hypothetical protein